MYWLKRHNTNVTQHGRQITNRYLFGLDAINTRLNKRRVTVHWALLFSRLLGSVRVSYGPRGQARDYVWICSRTFGKQ